MAPVCSLHAMLLTFLKLCSPKIVLPLLLCWALSGTLWYNVNQCMTFSPFFQTICSLIECHLFKLSSRIMSPKTGTIQYNASGFLAGLTLVLCKMPIPRTRTDSDRQGRRHAVHRFIALQSLINIRLVLVFCFFSWFWVANESMQSKGTYRRVDCW